MVMFEGEETFAESDAKYAMQLISEVSRDFWLGAQSDELTLELINKKIMEHRDRVRLEG